MIGAPKQLSVAVRRRGPGVLAKEGIDMERRSATRILAGSRNGTLYAGVTSNLIHRIWQHRNHLAPGLTDRYTVTWLVRYGTHGTMEAAITPEKHLKIRNRSRTIRLAKESNPCCNDPWPSLIGDNRTLDPRLRGDDEPR